MRRSTAPAVGTVVRTALPWVGAVRAPWCKRGWVQASGTDRYGRARVSSGGVGGLHRPPSLLASSHKEGGTWTKQEDVALKPEQLTFKAPETSLISKVLALKQSCRHRARPGQHQYPRARGSSWLGRGAGKRSRCPARSLRHRPPGGGGRARGTRRRARSVRSYHLAAGRKDKSSLHLSAQGCVCLLRFGFVVWGAGGEAAGGSGNHPRTRLVW